MPGGKRGPRPRYETLTHPVLDDAVQRLALRSKVTESGCWTTSKGFCNGYSQVSVLGHPMLGHMVAWLLFRGPIPEECEDLDHFYCNTPACWNPWHVDPVTHAVNMHRARVRRYGVGPRPTPPSQMPAAKSAWYKKWRQATHAARLEYEAAYRAANREKINARNREWKRRDRARKKEEL